MVNRGSFYFPTAILSQMAIERNLMDFNNNMYYLKRIPPDVWRVIPSHAIRFFLPRVPYIGVERSGTQLQNK